MRFEPNLSVKESVFRYVLMMIFPILGGLLGSIPLMILGIPFFLTGMLGYCPIYDAMGIDHSKKEHPFSQGDSN
jgi:hypothetical protein